MADVEKQFGKVLRELRQGRGLSQEELGYESELTRNYVSQLELGAKSPSLRTVFCLASALGTTPSEMLKSVESRLQPDHGAVVSKQR